VTGTGQFSSFLWLHRITVHRNITNGGNMKTFLRLSMLLGAVVTVMAQFCFAQPAVGDYGAVADGNWGTVGTWKAWDGTGWNTAVTVVPDTTKNVWIVDNHIVTVEASPKYCRNLTVESGHLFADVALPTSGIRYIRMNGDVSVTGGTLGGTTTSGGSDVLSLEYYRDITIGGSGGTVALGRIRPASVTTGATLTIDRDMALNYAGSSGTGGMALYISNSTTNDNITVTLNAGRTLTLANYAYIGISSSASSDGTANTTFNINGTVVMQDTGGTVSLRDAIGKTATLNVNGTLTIARNFYPVVAGTGTSVITVGNGGLLVVGAGGGGTADFSVPLQTVTGEGAFTLSPGATLKIGSPEGISASAATGPIQTGVRNFSPEANYMYLGVAPQVTGDGLPATVNDLAVADTQGVTLSGPVTVNGTLTVSAGHLDLNGHTVTLGPAAMLSENPGSTVTGTSGVITTTRTLNAPSDTVDIAGLGVKIGTTADLGSTVLRRGHAVQTAAGGSIKRYFDIEPTNNAALDATMHFHYDRTELNGLVDTTLQLYRSTDNGTTWVKEGGVVDTTANTITLTGIATLSRWSAATPEETPLPDQVMLLSPGDGADVRADSVLCVWAPSAPAVTAYWLERATDSVFTSPVVDSAVTDTSFMIRQLADNQTYWWHVRAKNSAGWGPFSEKRKFSVSITGIADGGLAPMEFSLKQNYPNPFNPSTRIVFTVAQTGWAKLEVFNILGERVQTLFEDVAEAGRYYVLRFDAVNLPSGTYFYRLQSATKSDLKKLLVLK
jgi:hypothetical protein